MTFIEGIGDDVIHFFIALGVLFISLIAWRSTSTSNRPRLRTVVILERRTTRHAVTEGQTTLQELRNTNEIATERNQTEEERKVLHQKTNIDNEKDVANKKRMENVSVNKEEKGIKKKTEESNTNGEEGNSKDSITAYESLNDNGDVDSILNEENKLENFTEDYSAMNACNEESTSCESHANEGNIKVKLKYLNDDQKIVEGKLQEQLGDFKRRHFSIELAGQKLVRLIFNGKVLQQDTRTLQNYGLFDNCVVHCLIHQPRTPPPSPNLNRIRDFPIHRNGTHHRHNHSWDLGNVLFASLSFLLGLAWYGRYQYAQLYTATTTVALIGLTGIFTVSFIGMYMTEIEGFR